MDVGRRSTVQVEGRITRRATNGLVMTFVDGPGEPLAVARQGGADGFASKLGVLFGFANGGRGRHTLVTRAGSSFVVASSSGVPTAITRDAPGAGGAPTAGELVARVERGATSTVFDARGEPLYVIDGDPEAVRTADAFRLVIRTPDGAEAGRLDVIRASSGWRLSFDGLLGAGLALDDWSDFVGDTGGALKLAVLGTRLVLREPPPAGRLDVLLAVCVDLAVGLRPYVAGMG
ncbi:hypothetical protein [Subtercola sp. YIM 133946]|uniref:hypothetical protein n=1 Tax=Subtercola sp. YIM 133946 TaxID=3118909 RepID=UPI002F93BF74